MELWKTRGEFEWALKIFWSSIPEYAAILVKVNNRIDVFQDAMEKVSHISIAYGKPAKMKTRKMKIG